MKVWAEAFYSSAAWHACRDGYMASVGGLCERCVARGEYVVAKIAHHIVWLTKKNINDPNITLNWDNLEALCQDCHNGEHHKKAGERRYGFDADGNLVESPPVAKIILEGRTPSGGNQKTPHGCA